MIINNDLYQQILQAMPIPCVDLLVVNDKGEVLLAKRTNMPAQREWWFPGGRIHYLETRIDAAVRKLKEECGLEAVQPGELGTFDVIVERSEDGSKSHAITTVFVARVEADAFITLDAQNSAAEWRLPLDWLKLKLNPFIERALADFIRYDEKKKVLCNSKNS